VKVLLALVASCCCLSTCTARVDCYECTGSIDSNCGQLTNTVTIIKRLNDSYCVTDNRDNTVSRSGVAFGNPMYPQYCSGSICYCNTTTLCNDERALAPTPISCYVCNSLPYFDNGCGNGAYWNPQVKYVRKETDCNACYKSQDGDSIVRGCVRSVHTKEGCYSSGSSINCECTGVDCNHASSLLPAYTAITISLIWKIFV